LVGDEPAMREWATELVERARLDGVELTGEKGLLTALVRQELQTGLEVNLLAAVDMLAGLWFAAWPSATAALSPRRPHEPHGADVRADRALG
jgi:hypothetical protein